MDAETYDVVIVGTGQSGKPLAVDLGRAGWRTAIVERADVGGTCINVGCTPSKTMIASGRVAYLARRHDASSPPSRRAMIAALRRQSSASRCSCARPARVRL